MESSFTVEGITPSAASVDAGKTPFAVTVGAGRCRFSLVLNKYKIYEDFA